MRRFILSICFLLISCGSSFAALYGAPFSFLLSQVRTSAGGALIGAQAYFYAAGTTTLQTIWLDRAKGTVAANPYTLDSNATSQLYGDGLYRIVIRDTAGVTQYDRDNINIVDYLTSGQYQALDSDYASLNAAVTAIGPTPTTLTIRTANYPVTASLTVPQTLTLQFLYPGSLSVGANNITVNSNLSNASIKGTTANITLNDAANFAFGNFSTSGTVAGLQNVSPRWFGNNITDYSGALQKALNCAVASNSEVLLDNKIYTYSTSLTASQRIKIKGAVAGFQSVATTVVSGSELHYTGSDYAIKLQSVAAQGSAAAANSEFTNFALTGTSSAKGGLGVNVGYSSDTYRMSTINLNGVEFFNFINGICANIQRADIVKVDKTTFLNCGVAYQGIQSNSLSFTDSTFSYAFLGLNLIQSGGNTASGTTIQSMNTSTSMSSIVDLSGVATPDTYNYFLGYTSNNQISGIGVRLIGANLTWTGGYIEEIANVIASSSGNSVFNMSGVYANIPTGGRLIETWGDYFAITHNTFNSTPSTVLVDYPNNGPGGAGVLGIGHGWDVSNNFPELAASNFQVHYLSNNNKTYSEPSRLEYDNILELGRTNIQLYGVFSATSFNKYILDYLPSSVITSGAAYSEYFVAGGILYVEPVTPGGGGAYVIVPGATDVTVLRSLAGITVTNDGSNYHVTNTTGSSVTVNIKFIH